MPEFDRLMLVNNGNCKFNRHSQGHGDSLHGQYLASSPVSLPIHKTNGSTHGLTPTANKKPPECIPEVLVYISIFVLSVSSVSRSELAPTCDTPAVTRWSKLPPTISTFCSLVGQRNFTSAGGSNHAREIFLA
jgi:hypothetical protein